MQKLENKLRKRKKLIFLYLGSCSHERAPKYYVESILEPKHSFMSTGCDSYEAFENGDCNGNVLVPMGEGLLPSM